MAPRQTSMWRGARRCPDCGDGSFLAVLNGTATHGPRDEWAERGHAPLAPQDWETMKTLELQTLANKMPWAARWVCYGCASLHAYDDDTPYHLSVEAFTT